MREVWLWAELERGRPTPATQEAGLVARHLAGCLGAEVVAWVAAQTSAGASVETLARALAETLAGPLAGILLIPRAALSPGAAALAIATHSNTHGRPLAFVFPSSSRSATLGACVAATLGTGLVSHCLELRFGGRGAAGGLGPDLEMLVPAPGGLAAITCSRAGPVLVALGPGAASRMGLAGSGGPAGGPGTRGPGAAGGRLPRVRRVEVPARALDLAARDLRLASVARRGGGPPADGGAPPGGGPPRGPDLTTARVIVAGGAGAVAAGVWPQLRELAGLLGAALGATRPAVDEGFAAEDEMIGQSGVRVAPDIYLAFGISGDLQHTVGLEGAKTVVAINRDPAAPIFGRADYGVVASLESFVPALIAQVRRANTGLR